ncbi:MAG: dihydrodipicolinate synthase family protein [Rhodospirillales bacterium]|nr:dihydrodipicolinate synthase family protein [Rhodospirillales bacterium]
MALLDETARGVYIISATPFTDTGAMDWASTDRLVDFYLECGVDGITILGVMGEAPKLTAEESTAFVERVVKRAAGRAQIVVGVSNPGLPQLGDFARRAMDLGAAGVMVSPVPGLKTEEQIWAYLESVAAELGEIPVVLQDYPQLTQVFMSAGLLNRAFATFPTFKMLKHEEAPGLRKLSRVRAAEATGERRRRISILVGNGGIHLCQELARGADGAMTGFAFPEMLVEVCRLWAAGEKERAEDIYDAYLPVVRHEQQPGIGLALRKETLRRRGIIASAKTRAPGPTLDDDDRAELTHLLDRLARAIRSLGLASPAPQRIAGE